MLRWPSIRGMSPTRKAFWSLSGTRGPFLLPCYDTSSQPPSHGGGFRRLGGHMQSSTPGVWPLLASTRDIPGSKWEDR
jgi:hypothetical protein